MVWRVRQGQPSENHPPLDNCGWEHACLSKKHMNKDTRRVATRSRENRLSAGKCNLIKPAARINMTVRIVLGGGSGGSCNEGEKHHYSEQQSTKKSGDTKREMINWLGQVDKLFRLKP